MTNKSGRKLFVHAPNVHQGGGKSLLIALLAAIPGNVKALVQLAFKLTSNPLLCSLFGLTLANTVAQFGITPRQDIPFYSMILGFVLLVSIVQSDKVCRVMRKFGR